MIKQHFAFKTVFDWSDCSALFCCISKVSKALEPNDFPFGGLGVCEKKSKDIFWLYWVSGDCDIWAVSVYNNSELDKVSLVELLVVWNSACHKSTHGRKLRCSINVMNSVRLQRFERRNIEGSVQIVFPSCVWSVWIKSECGNLGESSLWCKLIKMQLIFSKMTLIKYNCYFVCQIYHIREVSPGNHYTEGDNFLFLFFEVHCAFKAADGFIGK